MNCYHSLAAGYNRLTGDVPYPLFADYYEQIFRANGGEFSLLLDLCCGTGTLTWEMTSRGYEMIAVDGSEDMLMQAFSHPTPAGSVSPLFLCQGAENLDLYGTVDAAFSSLDSFNYLSASDLPEVFHRLHLFIRPDGLLIFDIRPSQWLRSMDGQTLVDEDEEMLCLWRADFDETQNALIYGLDLFRRAGRLWSRSSEEHVEYAHTTDFLRQLLVDAGFHVLEEASALPDFPDRIFIIAQRDNT